MNLAYNLAKEDKDKQVIPALDVFKGIDKNPYSENTKHLGKLNTTMTLGELEKVYSVSQSSMYYKCSPDVSLSGIKNLNLNNIKDVRDFVTLCVNQAYLKDCFLRRVEPKGMIAVPEHLIYYVYGNVVGYEEDKIAELASCTDDVLDRYTGKDGPVHFTCYYRQIKDAYEALIRHGDKHKGELLPDYSNEEDEFEYNVEYVEPEEKCDFVKKRISWANEFEKFFVPKKYRAPVKVYVSNDMCFKYIDERGVERYRARVMSKNEVAISLETFSDAINHEKTHLNTINSQEVSLALCDFLYGISMGIKPRKLSEVNKLIYRDNEWFKHVEGYDPYQIKMPVMKKAVNGSIENVPIEIYNSDVIEY